MRFLRREFGKALGEDFFGDVGDMKLVTVIGMVWLKMLSLVWWSPTHH
jgi:hypothetical protein